MTIVGTNLTNATVNFGHRRGRIVSESATRIVVISPPNHGTVPVTVTTSKGASIASSADQFKYFNIGVAPVVPPIVRAISQTSGVTTGGTKITLTGMNLEVTPPGCCSVQVRAPL